MGDEPETCYARTADGAHIAYQVVGAGPVDLVFLGTGPAGNVDIEWEVAPLARMYRRLATFCRLIRFDHRGSGLSDPLGLFEQLSLEGQAKEVLTVLDAAGSEQAAVVANGGGGLLAMFFAATYPGRVSSLVLDGCYARLARDTDYPWGYPTQILDRAVDGVGGGAADAGEAGLLYMAPNAMRDPEFVSQWARWNRSVGGPSAARGVAEMLVYADVRSVLGAIQAPTLVMYRTRDAWLRPAHSLYLAEHIAGAKLVELEGDDNYMFVSNPDAAVDQIEEFLTGATHAPDTDRVLATVLFTDIVGSTELAARLGDRGWSELLDAHDAVVRRQLERFRGQEIHHTGDGFLATFDGPGRAIECACAIRDAVITLDIEIRAGLHTGEVEIRGSDLAGIAVHLAQRVSTRAEPSEVLVSRTVSDLVAGSGISFADRGEHQLKGVPGSWQLFAVQR